MISVARARLKERMFRQFWRMTIKKGCMHITGNSMGWETNIMSSPFMGCVVCGQKGWKLHTSPTCVSIMTHGCSVCCTGFCRPSDWSNEIRKFRTKGHCCHQWSAFSTSFLIHSAHQLKKCQACIVIIAFWNADYLSSLSCLWNKGIWAAVSPWLLGMTEKKKNQILHLSSSLQYSMWFIYISYHVLTVDMKESVICISMLKLGRVKFSF